MISDIVARAAILVALQRSPDTGVAEDVLRQNVPGLDNHLRFLSERGVKIDFADKSFRLKTSISFDPFQSIPPEIRGEVEKLADQVVPLGPIARAGESTQKAVSLHEAKLAEIERQRTPTVVERGAKSVLWIARGEQRFPVACIHCYQPACFSHAVKAFGPTDAYASRVCPSDVIKQTAEGLISIQHEGCTACMLCILRCPISVIHLADGIAVKPEYTEVEGHGVFVALQEVSQEKKRAITEATLARLKALLPPYSLEGEIKSVLDNFEQRSGRLGANWDQDNYYVWVRNCLRELGLQAAYTGSAGKLKRADVTVTSPFLVGVEVKSPAEGDITVGAIRQALDAGREVSDAFKGKSYQAVVGPDIARGSHARALSWERKFNAKIPLFRGRYLLYLVLKHRTGFPLDPDADARRLFAEYNGWFGREELKHFFKGYFERRKVALQRGKSALPMPNGIEELTPGDADSLDDALRRLSAALSAEIDLCFPDPERAARGGYSHE